MDWSNFKMVLFPKTSRASIPAFYPQILVSKLISFKSLRMRRNHIVGAACRFCFDHFHMSVHSFIRDRKHYKTVSRGEGGGEEDNVTLPSQIYSSYVRDSIDNSVRNIKTFPNVVKNLVARLLVFCGKFLLSI